MNKKFKSDVIAQTTKLDTLQFFRAIAALMVVLVHVGDYFVPIKFEVGRYGVDVFFVISGFIMAYIHHDKIEPLKAFFLKRFIRIYPTYLEILLIAILLLGLEKTKIAPNLFFTDPDPNHREDRILVVAWTLSYEIWFYFVFAISMWLFGRKFYTGILIFFIATILNQIFGEESLWLSHYNYEFCFGAALCFFFKKQIISLDKKISYPKIIMLIGDASYSLYLLHFPLSLTLGRFLHKFTSDSSLLINLFWYLVLIALIVSISIFNYLFIEKKIIKKLSVLFLSKDRLFYSK